MEQSGNKKIAGIHLYQFLILCTTGLLIYGQATGMNVLYSFSVILFLLLLPFVPALIAIKKGRNVLGWILYSVFLWPLALIHAMLLKNESLLCRQCFSGNDPRAKICKECKQPLNVL